MRLLRLVIGLDGEELRSRSLLPHEKAPSPVGELGGSLASEGEEIAERNLRQQAGRLYRSRGVLLAIGSLITAFLYGVGSYLSQW